MKKDLSSLLKSLIDGVSGENLLVKKTTPAAEWTQRFTDLEAMAKDIIAMEGKLKALRNQLWADIELKLNDFNSKRYNEKTNEIEYLEDPTSKTSDGAVKSPFQL